MASEKVTRRCERGVWVDPGTGPGGELAASAIDSRNRRIATCLIPFGTDSVAFVEALQVFLDTVDPLAAGATSGTLAPPRWMRLGQRRDRSGPVSKHLELVTDGGKGVEPHA